MIDLNQGEGQGNPASAARERDDSSFRPSLLEIPLREPNKNSHLNISSSSSNASPFEYSIGSDGDNPHISPRSSHDMDSHNEGETLPRECLVDMDNNDNQCTATMYENEAFLTPKLKAGFDVMAFTSYNTIHESFDGNGVKEKLTTCRSDDQLIGKRKCEFEEFDLFYSK